MLIKSRGILNPKVAERKFRLTRHAPSGDLAFFIERYWIIHWDLQAPYTQETLPYPCVNLVFEKGNSRAWGVIPGKFARRLEGKGGVFGVKFRPGAFYPFLGAPVSTLTNDSICVRELFGDESLALEQAILALDDEAQRVELVENFFRARLPEHDEHIAFINQIVDTIIDHREIRRVDDVVDLLGLNKRALQRLFSQYVGVSPKWVIQRYRLHEAAEQLADGSISDCAKLALELGYFDQAHFIKDFKAIVGRTPVEYIKDIGLR